MIINTPIKIYRYQEYNFDVDEGLSLYGENDFSEENDKYLRLISLTWMERLINLHTNLRNDTC